ncbi:hypothetical protein EON65_54795 [archaeon]|nr:MAG: hypothetical protein EON65_54795 [archaeon]
MGNYCCGCCCDIEGRRGKYQAIPGRDDTDGEHTNSNKTKNPQSLLPSEILANEAVPPPNLPSEFYLQYELGELLGIGTTSRVYAVQAKRHAHAHTHTTKQHTHTKSHTHSFPLACKVIDKRKLTFKMHRSDSEALLLQLRKEVDILRRLSHPHVVTYVDFLESRDFIVIITERLMGGELFEFIASQGALPEEMCRMYMYGVCSALVYMHDRGVVHRDIKPENLIFCVDGTGKKLLKLIDFGFSTVLKHELTGSFLG